MLGSIYGSREFLTAVVALAINSGAYICELLRGGLDSIDKGQMEAGRSLGFSNLETMRYIASSHRRFELSYRDYVMNLS